MTKPTLMNWVFLLCLGMIWGASFMGSKIALGGFGPMTVSALRLSIGAIILLGVMWMMGHRPPPLDTPLNRRKWLHMIGMGLFSNAIPFSLLNWGQLSVSSGFAGITMAVVPLLVLPLAHFLSPGEQMNTRKVIGFVIGFCGVIVLIGPETILGQGDAPLARLACVAASCCYATGAIITRLCPPVPTFAFSATALTIGSIFIIPVALMMEGIPEVPDLVPLLGVLYLGLFPTALATLLLVAVINTAGPSFLSLVNYQVPVWAVILGVLILGETIPPSFVAALALILTGLAISQRWRRESRG